MHPPARVRKQVVKGKVLLGNGKPLTRGRVVLTPKQEPMLPLLGDIEPDGSFTLKAGGFLVGVSHGNFLVSVEPPGYVAGSRAKPKNLAFPARYLDPENGLTATIAPETSELPADRAEVKPIGQERSDPNRIHANEFFGLNREANTTPA